MLESYPQHAGKLASRTAVAVFFTIFANRAPNPQISVQSDVLCWLILLVLLVATRQNNRRAELAGASLNSRDKRRNAKSSLLWSLASCIALTSLGASYQQPLVLFVSSKFDSVWYNS